MPDGRKGRGIKADRAIRAFGRLGFELDHMTGSHSVLRHLDGRRVVIPVHREVKTGLLLDQLKKVNILWEDFEDVL